MGFGRKTEYPTYRGNPVCAPKPLYSNPEIVPFRIGNPGEPGNEKCGATTVQVGHRQLLGNPIAPVSLTY